ncbi:MAG: hypothetical protein QNK37_18710 [Acidobacteriota bacterium]|nr:hypothetical protein [Acidobacteriota bacterium]
MQRSQTIERRIAAYGRKRDRINRIINLIATGRVFCFIAILLGGSFAFDGDYTYQGAAIALAGIGLFLFLMVRHDRCYRFKTRCELLIELLEADLARATYRLGDVTYNRPIPFPDDHPFAADLDLTGPNALLKAIDNSFHARAKQKLRDWLENPDPLEVIEARQQAVNDLAGRKGFRQKLALAAHLDSKADLASTDLDNWLAVKRPWTLGLVPYIAGRILALLTTTCIVLTFFFRVEGLPWLALFLLQITVFYIMDSIHKRFVMTFMERGKAIAATCSAISLFERMRVNAPRLAALKEGLVTEGKSAGPHLKKLLDLHAVLEYRSNGFAHFLLNGLFLWDQHYLRSLAGWRDRYGQNIPAWVTCVFEVEALSALANFQWLYPGRPFPELVEGDAVVLEAEAMGHPAIAEDKRVCNDYLMPASGKLHLITGSNMSGKSTFLRTIGVNLLLARLGLPVCAERLRCSLPKLMTSIRIADSLAEGVSYFYAEVRRIKQILDVIQADEGPVFYLLDEILKGTNSRERLIATKTMVTFLLQHNASGLITTHDLELLAVQEQDPNHITNYHFQESVRDDEMFFDYRLKPGKLTSTNALRLMKMAGVPLELN